MEVAAAFATNVCLRPGSAITESAVNRPVCGPVAEAFGAKVLRPPGNAVADSAVNGPEPFQAFFCK
jgi:hypothetical protein